MRKIGERTQGPLEMEIEQCPRDPDNFIIVKFKLSWDETKI